MRLHDVGLSLVLGHVALELRSLVCEIKRQRYEVIVVFEVPSHSLEHLSEFRLVCSDTCPWQSVVDGSRRHDSLIV